MKNTILIALALSFVTPALAQKAPIPIAAPSTTVPNVEFLQQAIKALQAQRNSALDAQAVSESKLAEMTNHVQADQLKIKGLEDKLKAKDKSSRPKKK